MLKCIETEACSTPLIENSEAPVDMILMKLHKMLQVDVSASFLRSRSQTSCNGNTSRTQTHAGASSTRLPSTGPRFPDVFKKESVE